MKFNWPSEILQLGLFLAHCELEFHFSLECFEDNNAYYLEMKLWRECCCHLDLS